MQYEDISKCIADWSVCMSRCSIQLIGSVLYSLVLYFCIQQSTDSRGVGSLQFPVIKIWLAEVWYMHDSMHQLWRKMQANKREDCISVKLWSESTIGSESTSALSYLSDGYMMKGEGKCDHPRRLLFHLHRLEKDRKGRWGDQAQSGGTYMQIWGAAMNKIMLLPMNSSDS